jgi:hypothetical protein
MVPVMRLILEQRRNAYMIFSLRLLISIPLFGFIMTNIVCCQNRTSCPVLPTLASSKQPWSEGGEHIVIWYLNGGRKTARGIQFELFMLDGAGNRYPASQRYIATGELEPRSSDVVDFPTDVEKGKLGSNWASIDGLEVRVTRIKFKDGTVWIPQKGQLCKKEFMNEEYAAAIITSRKKGEQLLKNRN